MNDTGDGWTYVDYARGRFRWRHDGEEHAHPSSGYTVETWFEHRQEWREVRQTASRDWFAIGFKAAMEQHGLL